MESRLIRNGTALRPLSLQATKQRLVGGLLHFPKVKSGRRRKTIDEDANPQGFDPHLALAIESQFGSHFYAFLTSLYNVG